MTLDRSWITHQIREAGLPSLLGRLTLGREEHFSRYFFVREVLEKRLNQGPILDLACGVGYGGNLLAKEFGDVDVYCADIHENSLVCAQRHYGKIPGRENLRFVRADALSIPFSSNRFEVVVSLETIEHLSDQTRFLNEVTRVLRPEGVFIVSSPNREITSPGRTIDDPENPFHLIEYNFDEFKKELGRYFGRMEFFGQMTADFRTGSRLHRKLEGLVNIFKFKELTKVVPLTEENVCSASYLVAVCSEPLTIATS